MRCRILIAPKSVRPTHVSDVTRRYILPAVLEYLSDEQKPESSR